MRNDMTQHTSDHGSHTPGPWTIKNYVDGLYVAGTDNGIEETVADVYNCAANARLIAAAPMLLEALEAANVPHTMPAVHKMVTGDVAGCPGCLTRAAIRAAKGESNG